MRICMLTSSHDIFDNRIYYKEVLSLKKQYDDIWIIGPGEKDFTTEDGIHVRCFPKRTSWHDRVRPMNDMYRLGAEVGADVYHAHEPDSFQVALKLKRNLGKKAIFDSHEYYPEAFSEHFKSMAPLAKKALYVYEKSMSKKADLIISVNDLLVNKFKGYNKNVLLLPNYPIFEDKKAEKQYKDKPVFVYVGEQREDRGILKILEAIKLTSVDASFVFVGRFINDAFKAVVENYISENLKGKDIQFVGKVPHLQVFEYLANADAGLVILQPKSWRYVNSEPIKLFEYMLSKTVVIGSDFPMIHNIVDKADCGFTVDPLDPADIAKTMDHVASHREQIVKMGENGYRSAVENYNWAALEPKLLSAYKTL